MKKKLCVLLIVGAPLALGVSSGQAWEHCNTDHPEKDCPTTTTVPETTTTTTTVPEVTTTVPETSTLPAESTTVTTAPRTPVTVLGAELPRTGGGPNPGVVVLGLSLPLAGGALIVGARRRRA